MDMLLPVLDRLYMPQAWLLAQSPYVSMTLIGLLFTLVLSLAGFVLARLGYKPLWALLLIVPTFNIVVLWALALLPFPRERGGTSPRT